MVICGSLLDTKTQVKEYTYCMFTPIETSRTRQELRVFYLFAFSIQLTEWGTVNLDVEQALEKNRLI